MKTEQAFEKAFDQPNKDLADRLEVPYNTIASWRFQFSKGALSLNKQIELLKKLGWTIKTEMTWTLKN